MARTIRIGTRGSKLALWQANYTQDALQKLGYTVEIQIIKTQGDQIQHLSFEKMEGKGFFTKEIEAALHAEEVDIAVHSHKDLETTPVPGLIIAAVPERAAPEDRLLVRKDCFTGQGWLPIASDAVVGTSSARRKAQMLHHLPEVNLKDLRGNVPTRVQKLRDGGYDAILLAKAGLERLKLDLSDLEVVDLPVDKFIPAPAQGALGLQIRENDTEMAEILAHLIDPPTKKRIEAERDVLRHIQGGCQVPLGAHVLQTGSEFELHVAYAQAWDLPNSFWCKKGQNLDQLVAEICAEIDQMATA